MALDNRLDAVGDDLARDQRELHPGVVHRQAVRDRGSCELARHPAGGLDTALRGSHESAEVDIARCHLTDRTADRHHGLFQVCIGQSHGSEERPMRSPREAFGRDA